MFLRSLLRRLWSFVPIQLILRILSYIPFVQSLTYFPFETHKAAIKKFVVLWLLTSLPILFAAVLSPVPVGEGSVISKLVEKLTESISISEQFVYTASFLTPILYIIFEKYENSNKKEFTIASSLKKVFKGYGLVAIISFFTILLTAAAFASLKTSFELFKSTFLYLFLVGFSGYIYLFSLYCWYLSLLDGTFVGEFEQESRRNEDEVVDGLASRLEGRA